MKLFLTVCLLQILLLPPTVRSACPAGFNYLFQCSCYKFAVSNEGREDAKTVCESLSAHLVFIESEEEQEFLSQRLSSGQFYWIGLNGREFEDKTWDDGSPAVYTNFIDWTNPFADDSGCYKIATYGFNVPEGSWHDDVCIYNYRYVCEYEDVDCTPAVESGPTVSTDCPSNSDAAFGCSCYKIQPTDFVSRDVARQKCENHLGYHLVFIDSVEERNFLAGTYDRLYEYWLGVNGRDFETKTWDDGTDLTYYNFGSDLSTFNDNSGCYRIVPDFPSFEEDPWQDWSCFGSYGYICEYEASCSPEVTTLKEDVNIETTSLPASTQRSTQEGTSTVETTVKTTSERMDSVSTSQTTRFITEISSQPAQLDAGVFFGLPPTGEFISGDSIMTSLNMVKTVTRCSVHCVVAHCTAFLYIEEDSSCRLALALDESSERMTQADTHSNLMFCSNVNDKLLCTSSH